MTASGNTAAETEGRKLNLRTDVADGASGKGRTGRDTNKGMERVPRTIDAGNFVSNELNAIHEASGGVGVALISHYKVSSGIGAMADGNKGMKIRHTMIRVADLRRSVDFYTQHLGMDLMRERTSEVRGERVAYVGYGDEDGNHALEIVEMIEPPAEYVHGNTYGHVALLVANVQEMSDQLKSAGVEFVHEPHQVRAGNPNMIAFIKDPDGYEIELTERR